MSNTQTVQYVLAKEGPDGAAGTTFYLMGEGTATQKLHEARRFASKSEARKAKPYRWKYTFTHEVQP